MKKSLLLPTAVFPYIICACFAYCFGNKDFRTPVVETMGIVCLTIIAIAFICNLIFILFSMKDDSSVVLKTALILKIIHIPAYVLIFIFGLLMGFMFFMTFPIIFLLVAIDCVTLFLSGMISVFSLLKNIKKNKLLSFLILILQFFFCVDVISLFALNYTTNKKNEIQT